MSISLDYKIFKGLSEAKFKETATELAEKCGGELSWNDARGNRYQKMALVANDDFLTVLMPYQGGTEHWFSKAIAERHNLIWMELRLQEEALWDYSLYKGGTHLHNFSSMPQYWLGLPRNWRPSRKEIRASRGDFKQLCEVWGCDEGRVKNYLRRWRMAYPWYFYLLFWTDWIFERPLLSSRTLDHWYWKMHTYRVIWPRGKAYESDEFNYGDPWQLLDFRRSLGAPSDQEASDRLEWHFIKLPTPSKQVVETLSSGVA